MSDHGGIIVEIKRIHQEFSVCQVEDFSLIGILAKIATVLADNGISIFAVSTYNTDYVLIKKENYEKGLEVLRASGYELDL